MVWLRGPRKDAVSYTHLDVYKRQVVDWKSYMHEVYASSLFRNPIVMGGPEKTVEVDEFSAFLAGNSKSAVYVWCLAVSAAKIKNVSFMLYQTEPLKPCLTQLERL